MVYFGGSGVTVLGVKVLAGRKPPEAAKIDEKMDTKTVDAVKADAEAAAKEYTDTAKLWKGYHIDSVSALKVLVPLHIGAAGFHVLFKRDPFPRIVPKQMLAKVLQID
eukprot:gene39752-42689_t